MPNESDVPSSSSNAMKNDRLQRLRNLRLSKNEARKLNHQAVVEEDKRNKLPPNFQARQERAKWQLEEIEAKKAAEERGEDYERLKQLETPADVVEKLDRSKKKKQQPSGFADFETLTLRQYNRNTQQMKPDMELYDTMKSMMGEEEFYPSTDTLIQGAHYPSKKAIDKLVGDQEKAVEKRYKFNRRRPFDPDAPIDYINEKNKRYNEKIERFYGKYTTDIKQSLERGTAPILLIKRIMEPMMVDSDPIRQSYNYCPECPEVIDSKLLLLLHFMAKHYVKYAEIRKRGIPAMQKEIPGFAGSKLEVLLQQEDLIGAEGKSDDVLDA